MNTVKDALTQKSGGCRALIHVRSGDMVVEALRQMRDNRVRSVLVIDDDLLEGCMAMMATRVFRHLPVLDAGKVVGVISIGDVVKDIIRNLEHNVDDLMGYIMTDGPGG